MDYKWHYITLPILCILLYQYTGDDVHSAAKDVKKEIAIQEHVSPDEEGGIITPAAKKFPLKKAKKKRKVYQTKTMKLYEQEDSDTFITRIEEELESFQVEDEQSYALYEPEDDAHEALIEKREQLIAKHQQMMLAFNRLDTEREFYEEAYDTSDSYDSTLKEYDTYY